VSLLVISVYILFELFDLLMLTVYILDLLTDAAGDDILYLICGG